MEIVDFFTINNGGFPVRKVLLYQWVLLCFMGNQWELYLLISTLNVWSFRKVNCRGVVVGRAEVGGNAAHEGK